VGGGCSLTTGTAAGDLAVTIKGDKKNNTLIIEGGWAHPNPGRHVCERVVERTRSAHKNTPPGPHGVDIDLKGGVPAKRKTRWAMRLDTRTSRRRGTRERSRGRVS
jgi:hypothetical protein